MRNPESCRAATEGQLQKLTIPSPRPHPGPLPLGRGEGEAPSASRQNLLAACEHVQL
jgi:hypothetical protein